MAEVNELNEQDAVAIDEPHTQERLLKEIVREIRAHLRSGQEPSQVLAKKLRFLVLRGTLAECVETGKSSWPAGLGRLKLVRLAPIANKRMFGEGEPVTIDRERLRVRYVMGTQMMPVLGYEGYHKYKRKDANPMEGVHPRPPEG